MELDCLVYVCLGMFQAISSASPSDIDVQKTASATYLVVSSDGGQTWTVVSETLIEGWGVGGWGHA